jgi:hypothetical protein
MNRAVHATAAEQGSIRGVYDCINRYFCYIAIQNFNFIQFHFSLWQL